MASLTTLRDKIAANLQTITGLRTGGFIPAQVNPPFAIVAPDSIDYHRAFANGLSTYNFVITLIVGMASERSAQSTLDAYCSPTGASSIKGALESNKTLDGQAFDLNVTGMRNYGSTVIGETTYLAAEFDLTVQAN